MITIIIIITIINITSIRTPKDRDIWFFKLKKNPCVFGLLILE